MAVDTIPSSPPSHERTEAAKRFQQERRDTTNSQAATKQQESNAQAKAQTDRISDNKRIAEAHDADKKVDVHA